MDLFNWYIDWLDGPEKPFLCGDVVLVPLRQQEYEIDKYKRIGFKQITLNDKKFQQEHKECVPYKDAENGFLETTLPDRLMKFIREPFVRVENLKKQIVVAGKTRYNLKNCDAFFVNNKNFSEKCKKLGLC